MTGEEKTALLAEKVMGLHRTTWHDPLGLLPSVDYWQADDGTRFTISGGDMDVSRWQPFLCIEHAWMILTVLREHGAQVTSREFYLAMQARMNEWAKKVIGEPRVVPLW